MKNLKLIIITLLFTLGFMNFSNFTAFATESSKQTQEKSILKSMENAKPLSINNGSCSDSLIGINNLEDFFKFTLKEDGEISLKVSSKAIPGDSDIKYTVSILDAFNNSYKSFQIKGYDGGTTFKLGLKKGTYYISLKKYNSWPSETIEYSLNLKFKKGSYEKEDNNTMSSATKLYSGKPLVGRIDGAYDYDYYKFTIPKAGEVSVNLKTKNFPGNESSYYNIDILNTQNHQYINSSIIAKNSSFNKTIGLPKGTYYIKVSPNSAWSYILNDYTISYTFKENSNFEIESNDTMSTANPLSLGNIKSGNSYTDDTDYFKINIKENGTYRLKFAHRSHLNHNCSGDYCWDIDLLDAKNNNYLSLTTGITNLNIDKTITLKRGTYYIRVYDNHRYWYSPSGDYKLSLTKVFSTPLKVNTIKTTTKTITGKGDKGATVTASIGKKQIGKATVDKNGNFKINIKSQKYKDKITFKMSKSGHTSVSVNKYVELDKFKTALKVNNIKTSTKTITGKGDKGATITASVGKKQIGKTTVDKNGNFKINIKNQKYKDKITFKMSKSGYSTLSKTITVIK